ncbi:MAG: TPM domain-containing protein, partial [Crocinitomicaceae bacterium]|nr:TPM domain-containing protein [Crocinitomicaceae bacterium]
MKKLKQIFTLISILLISVFGSFAQNDIPDAPKPERLYNNLSAEYSDLLSQDQARELEAKLENFAEQTSNQVVVVVVDDLAGYE